MLDPFMTGNVPGFIKRQNNVDKRPFLTIFTTFEMKFTVLLSTSSSCQKRVNLKNDLPVKFPPNFDVILVQFFFYLSRAVSK